MKAKYIKTEFIKDRFKPYKVKVYEYRGYQYTLTFDLCNNYLGWEIDVRGGHQTQQQEIDLKILIKEKEEQKVYNRDNDAWKGFELFYDYAENGE